jgi:hypothetical protein
VALVALVVLDGVRGRVDLHVLLQVLLPLCLETALCAFVLLKAVRQVRLQVPVQVLLPVRLEGALGALVNLEIVFFDGVYRHVHFQAGFPLGLEAAGCTFIHIEAIWGTMDPYVFS